MILLWLQTGRSFYDLDDKARMYKESIRQACIKIFARMTDLYEERYLKRRSTAVELNEVEKKYKKVDLVGCTGAVDCCKIHWKKIKKSLNGQLVNRKDEKPSGFFVRPWCDKEL